MNKRFPNLRQIESYWLVLAFLGSFGFGNLWAPPDYRIDPKQRDFRVVWS